MTADIPPLLADLGAGAGALAAVIALLVLITGIIARGTHRAAKLLRETVREEIPLAIAAAPEMTRELVREEVERALEPHAAQLRSELRHVREEMQPNGGSSMVDRFNRRIDSIEAGQRKIFAHLAASHGSLADASDPDPEDDSGQM